MRSFCAINNRVKILNQTKTCAFVHCITSSIKSTRGSIKFCNSTSLKENNIPFQYTNKISIKNYSTLNNSTSIRTLDPVDYEEWSSEQLCSLLCCSKKNSGAGLTIEDVQPLYHAGFKGASLANIVGNIQDGGKKYARDELISNKDYAHLSQTMLENVVNWIDNLLKTRFYHLWSVEQIKQELCKSTDEGGASLTTAEVVVVINKKFLIDLEKYKTTVSEETFNKISEWIDEKKLKQVILIDFTMNWNLKKLFKQYQTRKEPLLLVDPICNFDFKWNQQMVQELSNNYSDLETATDKQKIFLPCLACAPGTGKSRTLQEIFKYTEQSKKYNENCIEIRLSFGSGTGIQVFEKGISQILCSRILFSYFDIPSSDFLTFLHRKNWENVYFEDVIKEIVQDWKIKNSKTDDTVVGVYLAIDEFTRIEEHYLLDPTVSLKSILRVVGQFIQTQVKIKLFPIFAGLDSTFFKSEITESGYHTSYYTPYRYSDDDLISIVKQVIPSETYNAKVWKAIHFLNRHPRMLEWFLSSFCKCLDAHKAYDDVCTKFRDTYRRRKLSNKTIQEILGYTFTGETLTRSTMIENYTIQQLEDFGYVSFDNDQLTMSLPIIDMTVKQLGDTTFERFIEQLSKSAFDTTSHHDTTFEEFNALFEVVLNQSFLYIGKKKLTLKDRFRGVHFSETFKFKEIDLASFPSMVDTCNTLSFKTNQISIDIQSSTLIRNTFKRSPFFDRFANCKIDNEIWTILWQDRGTVSDYDCFTAPAAVQKLIQNHFTPKKLAVIKATQQHSLPIIITTKPFASTIQSTPIPENIALLSGRDGLEIYYGKFIYTSYLLNIPTPFPINNPTKYTDYELALFLGILIGKAKSLRSRIQKGNHISKDTLQSIVGDINFELSLIDFTFTPNH